MERSFHLLVVAQRDRVRGYTLIELILSVTILIIGITPTITAVQWGVRAGRASSATLVATHLAEEGLELVRNVRDSNWASAAAWDQDISVDGCYLVNYQLSTPTGRVNRLGATCPATPTPLNYDTANGVYGYVGWGGFSSPTSSPFTRTVLITHTTDASTNPPNAPYLWIQSTVSWDSGAHKVVLNEHLYNWRP